MSRAAAGLVVEEVGLDSLELCQQIRRVVFVEGQRVPESLEIDGLDGECMHFLARLDGQAVGCARLRRVERAAKAERVAVLAAHRTAGIGRALMQALEAKAAAEGFSELILNSQAEVVPFYEGLGYRSEGEGFEEAGIPHQAMRKHLERA